MSSIYDAWDNGDRHEIRQQFARREEIIRMAREAGGREVGVYWDMTIFMLERFAALVAAAQREKVARWQIGSGYTTGHGETIEDLLVELEWQVRESEREACARVCDAYCESGSDGEAGAALSIQAAIRARG